MIILKMFDEINFLGKVKMAMNEFNGQTFGALSSINLTLKLDVIMKLRKLTVKAYVVKDGPFPLCFRERYSDELRLLIIDRQAAAATVFHNKLATYVYLLEMARLIHRYYSSDG